MTFTDRVKARFQRMIFKAAGFPTWRVNDPMPDELRRYWSDGNYLTEPMRLAVVYGCIRVMATTIGSLPWNVYSQDDQGNRKLERGHPLYPLLHKSPNAYMSSASFRQAIMVNFGLRGNAYVQVVKLGKRVTSLNILPADRCEPYFKPPGYTELVYRFYDYGGKQFDFQPEEIIHVRNFSMNGIFGLSPIASHAVMHAHQAESYGSKFFENSGRPSGVLESDQPAPVNDETRKKLEKQWADYSGVMNAGKTAVLYGGLKYHSISIAPDDAQYIETRKFSVAEIAGMLYGVPANMLGHSDKTATYASAEEFDNQFTKHSVRPTTDLIEQEFDRRLFPLDDSVFCEMDLNALEKGNMQAQADYYEKVHRNGGMTANEFRKKTDLPMSKEENADKLMVNNQTVPLELAGKVTPGAPFGQPAEPPSPPKTVASPSEQLIAAILDIFKDRPKQDEQLARIEKAITEKRNTVSRIRRLGDGSMLSESSESYDGGIM